MPKLYRHYIIAPADNCPLYMRFQLICFSIDLSDVPGHRQIKWLNIILGN